MSLPSFLRLLPIAALLTACTQGPDFKTPEPPATSAYSAEGESGPGDGQTAVMGQESPSAWWKVFRVPAIDALVERALADNHSLAAATARLTEAREVVAAEQGGLEPQLAMDGTVGRQRYGAALFGPSGFQIPPFNYYEVGPSASFLLDIFGGQKRSVERQQALAFYQEEQWRAASLTLTGDVLLQALSIAAVRGQIAVVEQIIADDEQTVSLVQTGNAAGALTRNDALTAQAQLAADRTQLPALRQQLALSRHALAVLIGQAPADWKAPDFELAQFTLPAEIPLALPSELLHRRPDIQAAEAQLHAATAAVGIAAANQYPHITLTANATLESLQPQNIFELSNAAAAMAANAAQPIFDGGTLAAQKKQAEAAMRAELELYRQTVLAAFAQIADSLQALQNDAALLASQRQALETAEQSLELARQSYRDGNSGVLQILTSQRLHSQAQLGALRAQVQRLQDTTQLFVRLGSGV